MSVWNNDIKCKYMFLFLLKNLAHKGLSSMIGTPEVMLETEAFLQLAFWLCYRKKMISLQMKTTACHSIPYIFHFPVIFYLF